MGQHNYAICNRIVKMKIVLFCSKYLRDGFSRYYQTSSVIVLRFCSFSQLTKSLSVLIFTKQIIPFINRARAFIDAYKPSADYSYE